MKHISISILIFVSLELCASTTKQTVTVPIPPSIKTISVKVINNNQHDINCDAKLQVPTSTVSSWSTSSVPHSLSEQLWHFCIEHKYKLLLGGIVAAYGTLLAIVHYLERQSGWSQWHAELSVSELMAREQKQVAQELLDTIQRTYAPVSHAQDFLDPLAHFINDCSTEKRSLKKLLALYQGLEYTKIALILPFKKNNLADLEMRIERIRYLKHLLVTHLSEYKVDTIQA